VAIAVSAHSEFSLIKQYFEQITAERSDVILGIGDDCALLQCPEGQQLAVSIDTLVEGTHFFPDVDPESLGHKSLAVGLSDLAAMGATPAWFTLALTLPKVESQWLAAFSKGLANLAKRHNIALVGGDTTQGSLSISIQVHGFVKAGEALRRDGAKKGDLIYVTGCLGDAGAALALKQGKLSKSTLSEGDIQFLCQRLERPSPRVEIGQTLVDIASAAIDISDGLVADLGHILQKSGVGGRLELDLLPLSPVLSKLTAKAEHLALYAGDDYELCFTVSAEYDALIQQQLKDQCTCIGMITDDSGIVYIKDNQLIELTGTSYEHFSTQG
jgi:thiamine-monophosphate kinase